MKDYKGEQSTFAGTLSFAKDVNNPNDSNYAYSNAMLGVVTTYTEASTRLRNETGHTLVEWYVQDTWKVTKRLSLDYGVRFTYFQQPYNPYNQMSNFQAEPLQPEPGSGTYAAGIGRERPARCYEPAHGPAVSRGLDGRDSCPAPETCSTGLSCRPRRASPEGS